MLLEQKEEARSGGVMSMKEWLLAFGLLITFVALTTTSGQLTNIAFSDPTLNFHAPFLFVFFKTVFRALAYPIYLAVNTLIKIAAGRKVNFGKTWR